MFLTGVEVEPEELPETFALFFKTKIGALTRNQSSIEMYVTSFLVFHYVETVKVSLKSTIVQTLTPNNEMSMLVDRALKNSLSFSL